MKLRLDIEVEIDDVWLNIEDEEERDWFAEIILSTKESEYGVPPLMIFSNEVGDEIGNVTKIFSAVLVDEYKLK